MKRFLLIVALCGACLAGCVTDKVFVKSMDDTHAAVADEWLGWAKEKFANEPDKLERRKRLHQAWSDNIKAAKKAVDGK